MKDSNTEEIKSSDKKVYSRGVKGVLRGIICLLFGHDWVSYNEHCYICSRCLELAPKG